MKRQWMLSGVVALFLLASTSRAYTPAPEWDFVALEWVGAQDRPVPALWLSTKEPKPANIGEALYFIGRRFIPVSASQLSVVHEHIKNVSCKGQKPSTPTEWDVYVVRERSHGIAGQVCVLQPRDACIRFTRDMSGVVLKDLSSDARKILVDFERECAYMQGLGVEKP